MTELSDIVIAGGGPVGGTLALGLAHSGLSVTVLEARSADDSAYGEQRALALSPGTQLILDRLGVWSHLRPSVTDIRTIHISQKSRFGRSILDAADYGREALGYIVSYRALADSIQHALQRSTIKFQYQAQVKSLAPTATHCKVNYEQSGTPQEIQARLAVVADGGRSLDTLPGMQRKTHDYGQQAIVTRVAAELPHQGRAYERFAPEGPIALLPWGPRDFALVWTGDPADIEHFMALSDSEFLAALHQHFGDRVGQFTHVEERTTFPLKTSRLDPATAQRIAVIGNAAQTVHPVAGQGFNLGLRDAWELATLVQAHDDPGAESLLLAYRKNRHTDTQGAMRFTDMLVKLFSNDYPGMGLARGLGLAALELSPPAREFVVRKMSFGARG